MTQADASKTFANQLLGIFTGGVLTKLIDAGYQTGLFEAANQGPGTSAELAARAGLQERYVREWLGGMVSAGIFRYEPSGGTYELPAEHAPLLTGDTSRNLAPTARMINHMGRHLPALIGCFRDGGGVSYDAFRPEFTQCMDDTWRRIYDDLLIDGFLGQVEGLEDRLRSGISVLDIGCGTGHAINLMAREYPASSFTGFEIAEDALDAGHSEASEMGLANVRFETCDVSRLPSEPKFGLITAFDAIHDQRDPAAVLRGVHDALAADGVFLMIEFKFESELEGNIDNPFAPIYYGMSLMHCTTVSLAQGGPGLGAVWGDRTAREMLAAAGFSQVERLDSPRPQNCIYVCHP
jgi:SAM-dependent methyltransferase